MLLRPVLFRFIRRAGFLTGGLALVVVSTRAWSALRSFAGDASLGVTGAVSPGAASPADTSVAPAIHVPDSLLGRSGALRFATLTAAEAASYPGFVSVYGEPAIHTPSVVSVAAGSDSFALLVLRPFGQKRGEMLNGYRLGRWPAERWLMAPNYFNPDGFVEVTQANQSLRLSASFVLGDFVTNDQHDVWPKYVALEERLIDKLELVLQDLAAQGIGASRALVLSGFRAPYYNDVRIDEGAARASRHQYGDAADILIDDDGDGRMDDLNRDGRIDLRDVAPLSAAVARVESRYPELVGGLGTYAAMGPRGPFAHVDVRGTSARWENDARSRRPPPSP